MQNTNCQLRSEKNANCTISVISMINSRPQTFVNKHFKKSLVCEITNNHIAQNLPVRQKISTIPKSINHCILSATVFYKFFFTISRNRAPFRRFLLIKRFNARLVIRECINVYSAKKFNLQKYNCPKSEVKRPSFRFRC